MTGCASVKISNIPPNLSKCTRLGWAMTEKENVEAAEKYLKSESRRMGGNYLYLFPVEHDNKNGKTERGGLVLKCK